MIDTPIRSIAIFCGSASGSKPVYGDAATALTGVLADRNISVISGGGKVGLMGKIADACRHFGVHHTGVMSGNLIENEILSDGLDKTIRVQTMHDRKRTISELSDGFVALPGGPGTFEEILEQWTWAQLGLHKKPCGLLNVESYFDPLIKMFSQMAEQGFLSKQYLDMFIISDEPAALIEAFQSYNPPPSKWSSSYGDRSSTPQT
ncbi:MAG: TIGR00730 family Rossman fold protein [Parvularculales bacterium]